MTSSHGRGLHLAAAVDQRSAYDADSYVELARLAESGGLDFVTLDDTFARPGPDALAVLSRLAPATSRIIERIAPLLGVAPVDESSPQITQALQIESLAGRKIEDY